MDLLSDEMTEEVTSDDVVAAGLEVQHSLVGAKATVIQAYIHRRICENGMTHRDCVTGAARTRRLPHRHPRARQLQRAQVRRLAGETWVTLRKKLRAFRELQDERVDVDSLLRRWLERAGLSTARFMPVLRDAWELEPQPTAYGVVNALTRVATHATQLRPRQRRLLNGVAGLLAFQSLHLCPRCFSLVRQPVADD
jgi:hypothetical protein